VPPPADPLPVPLAPVPLELVPLMPVPLVLPVPVEPVPLVPLPKLLVVPVLMPDVPAVPPKLALPVVPRLDGLPFTLLLPVALAPFAPRLLEVPVPPTVFEPMPLVFEPMPLVLEPSPFALPRPLEVPSPLAAPAVPLPESVAQLAMPFPVVVPGIVFLPEPTTGLTQSEGFRCVLLESYCAEPAAPLLTDEPLPRPKAVEPPDVPVDEVVFAALPFAEAEPDELSVGP
jgi:hypothetical protein